MKEKTRDVGNRHRDYDYLSNDLTRLSIPEASERSEIHEDVITEDRILVNSFSDSRTDVNVIEKPKLVPNSIELKAENNRNTQPLLPPRRRSSLDSSAFDDLDLPPRFPQRHSARNSILKNFVSTRIYSLNLESLENANFDNDQDNSDAQNSSNVYDSTPRTSNMFRSLIGDTIVVNDVISEEFAMEGEGKIERREARLSRNSFAVMRLSRPGNRRSTDSANKKPSLVHVNNDVSFASFLSSITFDASHPFEVSSLNFDDEMEQSRRISEKKKIVIFARGFNRTLSCESLNEAKAPVAPKRRTSSNSELPVVTPDE